MIINLTYDQVLTLISKDKSSNQIEIELSISESSEFINYYMPSFESWMKNMGMEYKKNMPTIDVLCNDVVNLKLTPVSYNHDGQKVLVTLMLCNRYWTKEENKIIFN
jgi:hypothetical protein